MLDPDDIAASYLHVLMATAQRLDLGGRAAALGRAVLNMPSSAARRCHEA
jgi:hypothetical protein